MLFNLKWITCLGLLLVIPGVCGASSEEVPGIPPAQGSNPVVELRGEWFYVDGEPFLIKGIGYSPYRPGEVPWKDTLDTALIEQDFQRISDAGFNTIRTWSPLPPEILTLAEKFGLMVLQGIWMERSADYTASAFRELMLQRIQQEVTRAKPHRNILAFLVGNELLPHEVYRTGIPETEALFHDALKAVKQADPTRFVSYANWPSLGFLDASMWDGVCFNLYPYEPSSVSHSFTFRSYIEHLKQTLSLNKPLVITEVGLSVSPKSGSQVGYGGNSLEDQRELLLKLWDSMFQAGAQGGAIFEWNDEWWKQAEVTSDEETHEESDPEEWFGLIGFNDAKDRVGEPRPSYEALKTYNQAIVLSPITLRRYQGEIPVTVYATEEVAKVRVHFGPRGWFGRVNYLPVTKLSRHWWKVVIPVSPKLSSGTYPFVMEALDEDQRILVRSERSITVGQFLPDVALSLSTDRFSYTTTGAPEPVRYTIRVTDRSGNPLANRPVYWSIIETQTKQELTHTRLTDEQGRIEGTYLVQEPGIIIIAAATPRDISNPHLRTGQQTVFLVYKDSQPEHRPSFWESQLPETLTGMLRHHPAFRLSDFGRERIVDYDRYGKFQGLGTSAYRYEVEDWEGLAAAVGEGIYPNEGGLLRDPAYRAALKTGGLEGSHWDFTFHPNVQLSFFKWAQTDEELGVKQFYTAMALERAHLWLHAIKAYHALLVHFPSSIGWTAFDPPTPWYVGKVARDKIEAILRLHPEISMRLEDSRVIVENGFDHNVDNDVFYVHPGRLVSISQEMVSPPTQDLSKTPNTRVVGQGRVQLTRYEQGHWQLQVDGKPWIIRGLTYQPTQVGESPDEGTLRDWIKADRNKNGRIDSFDTFVDANRNNRQDADEPTIGDFELIRDMGVNTLRLFHTNHPDAAATKTVLRQLYDTYGFKVIMGDFVGMYTIGSGASWEAGTDYLDPKQRQRMFEGVKRMVMEYKDEPYLLMWVLGNENNYGGVHGIVGGVGNAGKYPKEYYQFVNELATWIHSVDPDHPVALGNGDLLFLDIVATSASAIDVFGANSYRGWHGFGRTFFEEVQRILDKPVLITEYGCPAYQQNASRDVAEEAQGLYHFGNWVDMADNMAGRGVGNVIGGIAFEWSDEWWKAGQPPVYSPKIQETLPNWAGPFPGGWNFEEWYGLITQGDGARSPYLRQLRPSYRLYRALWNDNQQP